MAGSAFNPSAWRRLVTAGVLVVVGGASGAVSWWTHSSPSHSPQAPAASFFVSATGSDLSAGTSVGAAFLTFNKAYQAASPGQTVAVEPGSYPPQLIPYTNAKAAGSHCDWKVSGTNTAPVSDYSGCITFTADAGAVKIGGLIVEVPYVRLDGTAGGGTVAFDRTDGSAFQNTSQYCAPAGPTGPYPTSQTCTYGEAQLQIGDSPRTNSYNCYGDPTAPTEQNHDDVVQNITSNDAFFVNGGAHNAIINAVYDVGDWYRPNSATSHIRSCQGSPATFGVWEGTDSFLLKQSTLENLLSTHSGNAVGCLSWTCGHYEAIHYEQGSNVVIDSDKGLNNSAYGLGFFQAQFAPNTSSGLVFKNNVVDSTCSQQVSIYCTNLAGISINPHGGFSLGNITLDFNSFLGSRGTDIIQWQAPDGGAAYTGSNTEYANAFVSGLSGSACTTDTVTFGVTMNYESWGAAQAICGPNGQAANPLYTDVATFNATPLTGSPLLDFVPTSITGGYPPVDLNGSARPDNGEAFLDGGAIETSGIG